MVRDWCRSFKAKHVLVISDSCFSGALIAQQRSALPQDSRQKSRQILTSGGLHPVADGGSPDGRHSVFSYYLLLSLEDLANQRRPFMVMDLFNRIYLSVRPNSEQVPDCGRIQMADDQGGQLCFFPSSGPEANIGQPPLPPSAAKSTVNPPRPAARPGPAGDVLQPSPASAFSPPALIRCEPVLVRLPAEANMNLIPIPKGSCTMGSENSEVGRDQDEGPATQVVFQEGFFMSETEITRGQYAALTGVQGGVVEGRRRKAR